MTNEIAFLEDYLNGETDADLYEALLARKREALELYSDKDLLQETHDYFNVAKDAYSIVSVQNLYREWKDIVADLPSNIYVVRLTDGSDVQRLKQDLSHIALVEQVDMMPRYMAFVSDDETTQHSLRHL